MSVDSRSGYNRVSAYRLDMASGRYEELQTSSEIGGGVLQVNGFGDAAGFDGYMDHGFGGTSDGVVWDAAGKRTVAYACNGEWNCFAYLKAINARGMGAGSVTRGESRTMKAFRWSSEGGVEFLTDPSGVTSGLDVVGMTEDGDILAFNDMIAFIVKPNGHATLVAPPPNYRIVRPVAMNRNGQVVGMLF